MYSPRPSVSAKKTPASRPSVLEFSIALFYLISCSPPLWSQPSCVSGWLLIILFSIQAIQQQYAALCCSPFNISQATPDQIMDLSHIVSDFPFNQDHLSALPAELKRRVIDYLEHHDQLNTRLLSRVWSIIGFERIWLHGLIHLTELFDLNDRADLNTLQLRPNRNHAQKLIEVSQRPWLRERLKEIVFSVDDIDYIFLARWKVEFRPRYEPVIDVADEVRPSSDFDRAIDRWLFQSKPYYNSMQDVPTPQNDFCDPVLLARTLSVLTSVDFIHIKFGEHLFRNWPYVPQ
ncbi:uncharacterized protein RAG0_08281 [Rhynchosporium agropyri]|uniref:F-box domain-containing protein n=1 Tax=Rhynchosporium agropyri TaxID=914238 RepID=A0A1E1KQ39_9HELO|nr:uncharacterized protein RAG0_08281 [Rhynchosporium agropyri]